MLHSLVNILYVLDWIICNDTKEPVTRAQSLVGIVFNVTYLM